MKNNEQGFDTCRYMDTQIKCLRDRLSQTEGKKVFIEFGGKPFGDHHAARVLPGYDPDCKARILAQLVPDGKVVMVLNAKDVLMPIYGRTLHGRYRGDSGLRYDVESTRLINEAKALGIPIRDVVLAVSPRHPSEQDSIMIDKLRQCLEKEGVAMHMNYEISGYPEIDPYQEAAGVFSANDIVSGNEDRLIVFSPGGGSGKFGVILSEMYHSLRQGSIPDFIKFETFPVFSESSRHPLNLAFEASTADLHNKVKPVYSSLLSAMVTSYDKDIENFSLLKKLFSVCSNENNVNAMDNPTAMGVNRIMDGVVRPEVIIDACRQEIFRRVERYQREVLEEREKVSTLNRAIEIRNMFLSLYGQF